MAAKKIKKRKTNKVEEPPDRESIWALTPRDREIQSGLMYLKFKSAVKDSQSLLEKVERRDALSQIAWITRNLMELDIWIEYCDKSEENTREFWEDSIRDAFSLLAPGAEYDDPEFEKLVKNARGLLNPVKEPDAWKAVGKAAKAIGRKDYSSQNQMLSKFVHPTAMSILLPLPRRNQRRIQKQFADEGKKLAAAALQKLDNSPMAAMHRKYQDAIVTVLREHPQFA